MKTLKNKFFGLTLISLFTMLGLSFSACNKDDDDIVGVEDDPIEELTVNNYLLVATGQMGMLSPD